jgi:hypothetical protein
MPRMKLWSGQALRGACFGQVTTSSQRRTCKSRKRAMVMRNISLSPCLRVPSRISGARSCGRLRLHDLRGTHETLLLDAGVPVHGGVGTTRGCYCATTQNALARPTTGRPRSLANCRRGRCGAKLPFGSGLGPKPAAFQRCSDQVPAK